MCNQLIAFNNPSRRFDPFYDRHKIFGRCNQCSSCLQQNQNDWYVRLCAEFEDNQNKGGICFFPTLTYNDTNLPHYVDYNRNIISNEWDDEKDWKCVNQQVSRIMVGREYYEFVKPYYVDKGHDKWQLKWKNPDVKFTCPIFSTSDLQNFLSKMRVYIQRGKFNIPKDTKFKYIAFPQFGSKRTERSHWHLLFFVDRQVDTIEFGKLLQKSWVFGHFSWSKKHGAVVRSKVNAIKYVSRYVSRDEIGYSKHDLNNYLNNEDNRANFKPFRPRHLQSRFLGLSFLDKFKTNGEYDINKITDIVHIKGDEYGYSMPNYYMRHMFYDLKKDDKFPFLVKNAKAGKLSPSGTPYPEYRNERYIAEITELGKEYKRKKILDKINSFASKIAPFFNSQYLDSAFADKSWSKQKLLDKLINLRGSASLVDISIYENCFRSRKCFDLDFFEENANYKFMRDNFYDFYCEQLLHERPLYSEPFKKLYPNEFRGTEHLMYNSLAIYRPLDQLLSIIADLQKELGKQKTESFLKKRGKNILLRKQSNYNNYVNI